MIPEKKSVSLAIVATAFAASAAPAQQCPYDFAPLTAAMQSLQAKYPAIPGMSILILVDGAEVYSGAFGSYTGNEEVPVASASKWLSAALLASVIDDGLVGLDDHVADYVPTFNAPGLDQVTLRQCYSMTSGLGGASCLSSSGMTMEACVNSIAAVGLRAGVLPGTDFYYAGASMQTAGRVCEVVTGQAWNDLFQQRIAMPLGMSTTRFDHPIHGSKTNPSLAADATSTMHDYAKFCQMILDNGDWQGVQVLSPAILAEMHKSQTDGIPSTLSPYVVGGFGDPRYGLGNWLQPYDMGNPGGERINTSPGVTGFTPWIDQDRRIVGVYAAYTGIIVLPDVIQIEGIVRDIVDGAAVCCYGDCDSSGSLDFFDFLCFQNEFAAGTAYADCDRSGSHDFFDFLCFQNGFAAGCP